MAFFDDLGGGFGGMFGGGNPADAAMGYFDKAAATEKQYLDPFIERGGRAGALIEDEFGRMMQDPAAMLERFQEGYKPSKYYQMLQDKMGQAASNTAAAGGMRGSPAEQGHQQELTQALLGKDMQQYLQNVMGIHGRGLSGEEGLYGTGFEGARSLASDLANIYGTQGQLAFQGSREEGQGFDDMMKAGVQIAGMFI